jgi:hypothetical protein
MARNRHRGRNRSRSRSRKNFVNKTVENSVSVVKSTSKKYMPKVKTGLENVGSKVVTTTQKSVPYLQQMTRKFFNMFGSKTKKHRRH